MECVPFNFLKVKLIVFFLGRAVASSPVEVQVQTRGRSRSRSLAPSTERSRSLSVRSMRGVELSCGSVLTDTKKRRKVVT